MSRTGLWIVIGVVALACGAAVVFMTRDRRTPAIEVAAPAPAAAPAAATPSRPLTAVEERRQRLFEELQPVKLANCQLERFGESNDGGYLMCANLLQDVKAGYSYGISGYDKWGCDISQRLSIPVHQYDCFDVRRPACPAGRMIFHEECVGGKRETVEKRLFDTIENQLQKNGDTGKQLVMKMDVEGAEWASFLSAPDELFERIDQLALELHGVTEERFHQVIARLKKYFHVVNLHYNNHSCNTALPPFPSQIYEVLFVNKRIGVLDPRGKAEFPNPLDTPNNPTVPDCQTLR